MSDNSRTRFINTKQKQESPVKLGNIDRLRTRAIRVQPKTRGRVSKAASWVDDFIASEAFDDSPTPFTWEDEAKAWALSVNTYARKLGKANDILAKVAAIYESDQSDKIVGYDVLVFNFEAMDAETLDLPEIRKLLRK